MNQLPFTPRVLNIKPRRAPVALLLSVFFPGLGQMYNGQFLKGLLFFGLLLALQVVYGFMHDSLSINGVFGFMVSILLLRVLCILDAIRHARLQQAYTPKFYNTRGHYIVVMIIMALLMWYTRSEELSGFKLFKMPSSPPKTVRTAGCFPAEGDVNCYTISSNSLLIHVIL